MIADIGAGDGHLAVELVRRGLAQEVIATEPAEGPWRRVQDYVRQCGLEDRIQVRCGAGLEPLGPGETDVVIIAGLGALTIRNLLDPAQAQVRRQRALVLQPLNDPAPLRRWLWEHDLGTASETLVQEKRRHYPVLLVQPDLPSLVPLPGLGELNFQLGTYLIEQGHPQLEAVLTRLERQCDRVLAHLESTVTPTEQRAHWRSRQDQLKEARRCWQRHRP